MRGLAVAFERADIDNQHPRIGVGIVQAVAKKGSFAVIATIPTLANGRRSIAR